MTQAHTDWQDMTVVGSDDKKIGKIQGLYDDESGGRPLFATIKTGMFGGTSFMPLSQATQRDGDLTVPFTKDFVSDSPKVADDGAISQAEMQTLYEYYRGGGYQVGGGASSSAAGGYGDSRTDETRTDGRQDSGRQVNVQGRDSAAPAGDDAMTRSEERLHVGTEQVEGGTARLRKRVVTENVSQTVPVSHEEVRVEREPITEANRGQALSGSDLREDEHEVTLHADQVAVNKETVPVERVHLGTETVTEQQRVDETVRKEQIDQAGQTDRS